MHFSIMNIFVLHRSPRMSAQYHCDKHVVKMILETAQLLYSAIWVTNPSQIPEGAYKLSHKNHPCAIWIRQSLQNYIWTCCLGIWLCREYTFRYGKVHKTEIHMKWLQSNAPDLPNLGLTSFAMAMPDVYKQSNPVQAYRAFYQESKHKERRIVSYKKRPWPKFLNSS